MAFDGRAVFAKIAYGICKSCNGSIHTQDTQHYTILRSPLEEICRRCSCRFLPTGAEPPHNNVLRRRQGIFRPSLYAACVHPTFVETWANIATLAAWLQLKATQLAGWMYRNRVAILKTLVVIAVAVALPYAIAPIVQALGFGTAGVVAGMCLHPPCALSRQLTRAAS